MGIPVGRRPWQLGPPRALGRGVGSRSGWCRGEPRRWRFLSREPSRRRPLEPCALGPGFEGGLVPARALLGPIATPPRLGPVGGGFAWRCGPPWGRALGGRSGGGGGVGWGSRPVHGLRRGARCTARGLASPRGHTGRRTSKPLGASARLGRAAGGVPFVEGPRWHGERLNGRWPVRGRGHPGRADGPPRGGGTGRAARLRNDGRGRRGPRRGGRRAGRVRAFRRSHGLQGHGPRRALRRPSPHGRGLDHGREGRRLRGGRPLRGARRPRRPDGRAGVQKLRRASAHPRRPVVRRLPPGQDLPDAGVALGAGRCGRLPRRRHARQLIERAGHAPKPLRQRAAHPAW
jgi:hypothetical protein